MGMDVYGKNPKNKAGEYFRNSCWWWRPLWWYIEAVAPELAKNVPNAQSNDGDGLDATDSILLAEKIRKDVESGATERYARNYKVAQEAMPKEPCQFCGQTGIRDDAWVKGVCNGCHGSGKRPNRGKYYPFDVANVRDFALFLENCGGFEIN